jgi:DNA-binding Xre family transcriptional regulator
MRKYKTARVEPSVLYRLDIQNLARTRGIPKAYHLWLKLKEMDKWDEYVIDIADLAVARGVPHVHALYQRIGGSKSSLPDLWNGTAAMIGMDTINKLCEVLRCKPGRLFRATGKTKRDTPSGSKASAAEVWSGSNRRVKLDTIGKLCTLLRCKAGRLFGTE